MAATTTSETSPTTAHPFSSLPVELHAATRKEHAVLNQSIFARLPLCLPPHTDDPFLYAAGITAFSHIYFTIEQFWTEYLTEDKALSPPQKSLQDLYTPHLFRTARLKADLDVLGARLSREQRHHLGTIEDRSKWIEERLLRTLRNKPHVMLAYAWAMYLALFNGGRWMRQQFLSAGPDFWTGPQSATVASRFSTSQCLSFWSFDGTQDGEDIKQCFKSNFSRAEAHLSDVERADVVLEARNVFALCSEIVDFLDELLAEPFTETLTEQKASQSVTSQDKLPHSMLVFSLLAIIAVVWRTLASTCIAWIPLPRVAATKHDASE